LKFYAKKTLIVFVFFLNSVAFASADYSGQNLTGQTIYGGYQGANFKNAIFRNATLIGSISGFQSADFTGSDMTGATIDASGISSWQGVKFNNAKLEGTTFRNLGMSAMQGAVFQGSTINFATIFWDGQNYKTTSFDWRGKGMTVVPLTYSGFSVEGAATNSPFVASAAVNWSSGGSPWTAVVDVSYDGVDSARAKTNDNSTAWREYVFSGPAVLSFWWKVSSEQGFDVFSYSIDGATQGSISGETDWAYRTHTLGSGSHMIRWSYSKDALDFAGLDAGWIDDFSVEPAASTMQVSCDGLSTLSGSTINFGSIQQTSPSVAKNFTIKNNGNIPLEISSISLQANQGFLLGQSVSVIAPGGETNILVSMSSDAIRSASATLSIVSNAAGNQNFTVQLAGSIVAPYPVMELRSSTQTVLNRGATLDFGSLERGGGANASRQLSIRNIGYADLYISQVEVAAGFEATVSSPLLVSKGAEISLPVRMLSTAAGIKSGLLSMTSNDPAGLYSVNMSGTVFVGLGEAIGLAPGSAVSSGAVSWTVVPGAGPTQGYAAKSGAIGDNQASGLSVVFARGGQLTFNWKVSTQQGFDRLECRVNGVAVSSISTKTAAWSNQSVRIPFGGATVEWVYLKDAISSSGEDAGYVADAVFQEDVLGTPVISSLPVASSIVFGQRLSNSTLTGGVASVNGTSVPGSFAFANPQTQPPVGNSTHSVVFTPTDSTNYTTATVNVTVSVSKAGAVISTLPSASSITFGQAISSSVLTGGAANVAGSFAFASPSTKPAAGNSTQGVVFTPNDTGNYTTATANVTVRVLQAVPEVSVWPTASPLKFGQALSASVLSGGSAGVAGAFSFVNPSTIPPLGLTTQAVRFTPSDSGNYTTLSSNVTVTVDKAGPVISSLPTASAITEGQSLAASVLTGGSANVAGSFAFALPGTVPAVGNSTHGVVFSPVDAGNYTVAAGNVTVRVNALPSFSLNTTSTPGGNVTASAAGPHKQGSTVTLTAVPDSGFVFVRWAGNATGTVNPLSLTVGGNLSVVAIFSQAEPADTNVQEFVGGSLLGVGPSGSVAGGANGVAATPDGGMVSVGDFTGTFQALGQNHTAGVNNRSFAIKHSANGTIQWAVSTGASGALVKNERVAVDAAGNIFVAGTFNGTVNFGPATLTAKGNTNADIFVAKLHSSNGTVQWVASGGGTNAETVNGLLAGADGEAYVTGGYFGANATFGSLALASQTGGNSNRDAYLGRISSNGTWQWVVAAGGSSTDQGRAVAVRDAGSLWWGGNFQGSAAVGPQQLTSQGATDIFVAAVDAASGNTTSPIRFGGTGEDALTALVSDRGEGFYASGSFASDLALGSVSLANSGVGDGFVARWQKNAGWTWGVALQGGDDDLATSLAMDAEGRLYAGGYFASESLTAASNTLNNTELFSYDGFVARFTSVGGVKWLRGLRGDNNEYVRGVACVSAGASTGALHLVGYTESALSGDAVSLQAPKGSGDAFFVRMNPASAAPSRTVTVNPSVGGTVTLSPSGPSYPLGTQVTLTPLPAAGFGFVRWGGSASGNATPLTITVNQSVSIDAEFADIGAPLVTVTSPAEGMQPPSAKVDFTGVVTDNVGVVSAAWGLNGVEKGNLTLTQNGSFSVPAVPLVPGDNLFTVVAVDAAGNEAVEEVLLVWSPSRVFSLPATVSVNEGRPLNIPLILKSSGNVSGLEVRLNFDPAVFTAADFEFRGAASLGLTLKHSAEGRLDLLAALASGSTIPTGNQTIGVFSLRARSVPLAGVTSPITIEVFSLSDSAGSPLADGTGTSGCLATVRSRSIPGDINGNGFIESGDGALMLALRLAYINDPAALAARPWDVTLNDLNNSGSFEIGDVSTLLGINVGLIPKPSPFIKPQTIRTASIRTRSLASMSAAPSIPAFFHYNGTRTPVEVRVSGDLDDSTLLAEVVVPPMGSALNGLEFDLQYPTDLLRIGNALKGEAAPANADINTATANGTIRFAAFNNTPWADNGGTVMRVTFTRISGAAAGSVRHLITLENLLAFTAGGYDSLEVFQRPAALGRQIQNWLGEVVSNAPATADSDGDGMTNRQEFLAGTDPNDRGSRLQLDGFLHDPATGEQTLTWRAKRGVRYRVQSSENLSLWTTDNSTELLGNDGDVSLSIKPVGNKTKLFYRLQVVE